MQGSYVSFSTISSINFNLDIFYSAGNISPLKIIGFTFANSQYSYPSIGSLVFIKYSRISTYVIFSIIFGGIISLNPKSNKHYFYLLLLYFITFLLLIGSGGPLKYLYLDLLFKNGDILLALRNPYTALVFSFNLLYILVIITSGFRIFVSIYIYYQKGTFSRFGKYKKYIIRITALLIILIMVLPIILTSSAVFIGEAIPVAPLNARVELPEYEVQTANYIKEKLNNHGYAYLFPGGGIINENWSHGYDGYDLLPNLIGSNYVIDCPTNSMETLICEYIKDGSTWDVPNFASSLSDLGVKFIVIEGNITATPYWSNTYTPNYHSILYSLNHTSYIRFLIQIGSNYIYENTLNVNLVYIPKEAVNSSSAVDGIFPTNNLTEEYFNYINRSYPLSPDNFINASYNGSISISVNESERNETDHLEGRLPFSYTGYGGPSIFNQYPLEINPQMNYLIIKFKTNSNAAFTVNAITAKNTTGSSMYTYNLAKNDSIYNLFGSYNSLGYGDNKLDTAYSADWCSNTNVTTMVINLNEVTGKTIYKLLFSILPVADNGTGLNNVPITEWPTYENLTIYSIELVHSISRTTFIATSSNLDLNANLTYIKINGENMRLKIHLSEKNVNPIPVILTENYVNGWSVRYNKNVSRVSIINKNYSTEILVFPNNSGNNITINLYFTGNNRFTNILLFSLIAYILAILLLAIQIPPVLITYIKKLIREKIRAVRNYKRFMKGNRGLSKKNQKP
jgi:hypothetical protein